MTIQEIGAATVIQRNLRLHWQRKGRIFPSHRLDKTEAVAKQSLEYFGIGPLCINDRPFLPMGSQAIVGIIKPLAAGSSNAPGIETVGLARLPHEREDAYFSEELAVQDLLGKMGLTGVVYRGRFANVTLNFAKLFDAIKSKWDFVGNTEGDPLFRLFQCKTPADAIAYAKTLTKDERALCKLKPDNPASRLKSHYADKLVQLIFKLADLNEKPSSVSVPHYFFTGPETSGHSGEDVERIPKERRKRLAELVGAEEIHPSHLGGSLFPRFIFALPKELREEYCSQISTYSFEELMAVAYLLGIPDLSHEQLSCYNTPHGKVHLCLYSSDLKIYPGSITDENWLATLPHMDRPVSKNFRAQVKGWKDNLLGALPGLPFDNAQLSLLKSRIRKLALKLEAKDPLTWRELMQALRPDWVENADVTERLRQELLFSSNTVFQAEKSPDKGYVDLLHWKPQARRVKWDKYYQRVKEVEAVLQKIMPRVTEVVDLWQTQLYPEGKSAFIKEEDKGDPKKFIGYMCCGITTLTAMIFLRAHGIHSITSGSGRFDHAFLRIPTEYNVDIIVDPTYKQLFTRAEAMLSRYWHQLPPAIVGAPKDLREFFEKHRKLQGPMQGHFWIYPEMKEVPATSKAKSVDVVHRAIALREDGVTDPVVKLIRAALAPPELALLEKTVPELLIEEMGISGMARVSVQRAIELIQPYARRILHHGTPDIARPMGERPLTTEVPECYQMDDVFILYAVLLRRLGFQTYWAVIGNRKLLEVQDIDQKSYFLSYRNEGDQDDLSGLLVIPEEMLEEDVKRSLLELGKTIPPDWKMPEKCRIPDGEIRDVENALSHPIMYKELTPQRLKQLVKGIADEGLFRISPEDRLAAQDRD